MPSSWPNPPCTMARRIVVPAPWVGLTPTGEIGPVPDRRCALAGLVNCAGSAPRAGERLRREHRGRHRDVDAPPVLGTALVHEVVGLVDVGGEVVEHLHAALVR